MKPHGAQRIYRPQHGLWRLHLQGRSSARFVDAIGFLDTARQRKCQEVVARRRELSVPGEGRKGETSTAVIVAIEYAGNVPEIVNFSEARNVHYEVGRERV